MPDRPVPEVVPQPILEHSDAKSSPADSTEETDLDPEVLARWEKFFADAQQ